MLRYIERPMVSLSIELKDSSQEMSFHKIDKLWWDWFIINRAAAMTLRTVLLSLQALLSAAEPDDPQDAVVAKQYKENNEMFQMTARHWTNVYAGGRIYFFSQLLWNITFILSFTCIQKQRFCMFCAKTM